jgi:hypothetical protein
MLELLFIGFVFWIGYQLGVMRTAWLLRDIIRAGAKKELGMVIDDGYNIVDDGKEKEPEVYKLVIEKIKDTLYLYDHEDDFVCQALTVEDLAKLAKQYKNIDYAAVIFGDEMYMFVNGEVKTKL